MLYIQRISIYKWNIYREKEIKEDCLNYFPEIKNFIPFFFFFKQQIVTTENVIIDTVPVKIQISSFNLLWIVFITWNRKNKRTKKKKTRFDNNRNNENVRKPSHFLIYFVTFVPVLLSYALLFNGLSIKSPDISKHIAQYPSINVSRIVS